MLFLNVCGLGNIILFVHDAHEEKRYGKSLFAELKKISARRVL
jgi:hypothetical protein